MKEHSEKKVRKKIAPPGKKSTSFHLIDLLILLLILALIAAALYAYLPGLLSAASYASRDVEYTALLEHVETETAALFATGDSVLCGKENFGTVRSVETFPSQEEGRCDVLLTVAVSARVSASSVSVGSETLAAGCIYNLILPAFASDAKCVRVVVGGERE